MEDLQMYLPNEEDRDFKIEQKEISLPNSFQTNRVPEWIFDRGFTKETLRKWECGISLQTGSLIIPVRHVDDRLIGWIARQPPGAHPRYLYPSSMSTAQTVFGVNKMDGNPLLCITEGPLDTMWLDQIDFQSVCLFGAKMSNRQTEIIRDLKVKEIVLCLDNDATGQAAKKKIYDKLNKYFVVSSIILPEDYKDVQDVREYNVLTEIIESRSVFEI
jgi:DNA primase